MQDCVVLDASISRADYVPIDLSIHNQKLKAIDVSSSESLGLYINSYLEKNSAKVAYGGYLEPRNIYNRSLYFNTEVKDTQRNIHLGMDLWLPANAPVLAPLDAIVHSFKNNKNHGDYGPTIILKHQIDGYKFFTLYGHLSLDSIENLKIGQEIEKGQEIGRLGDASVNGDYPPHLHFQIIKDIEDYYGDYPGVCSKKDLDFYSENCLNPDLLLKLI